MKRLIFLLAGLLVACNYSAAMIPPVSLLPTNPPTLLVVHQAPPAAAPTPIRSALVTASRSVNIRAGASEHFPDVGDLYHGARVIILDCQQGWARTPEGWVKGVYLGGICQHD